MSERPPRQRKYLSQVFLKETWPAEKMVEVMRDWNVDAVVEIGPGDGVLTQLLIDQGLMVHAVEKDERFAERLRERWQDQGNFLLTEGDILEFDFDGWLKECGKERVAIVGNIPYSISSLILKWSLLHLSKVAGVGLMTQLEFAQRVASVPDKKSYGSLSVYTQMRASVELVCEVPKTVFKPVPKVDSAIVTLRHRDLEFTDVQLRRIEIVTKAAFSQKRKKLRNGIKAWLNKIGGEENISIDLERRPGTLTSGEYQQLAREIFPEDF